MSCECCAKVKEELQHEEDHLYAGIRIRTMESTIKFISERLEPSLLNKSFCDYFKNVRFENTTFSKMMDFTLTMLVPVSFHSRHSLVIA